ncbi:hypothetical protein ACIOMM_07145 [Streptomyces sp. NPDC087908]|uniref:hypothetical protein n=1 Tax=Streptomyces sp. NPDC087908 TaxID=3365820 RepID=UPI00381A40C2
MHPNQPTQSGAPTDPLGPTGPLDLTEPTDSPGTTDPLDTTHPRRTTGEDVPDARRRRAILVAACVALMAVVASVSGLNVAQPDLAVAFGASQSAILWIINIYTLALAALLLPLGAVGPDRFPAARAAGCGLRPLRRDA